MPMLPKKICVEAGCGMYAMAGSCRCAVHAARHAEAARTSETRAERAALYNTKQWAQIRRAVLDRRPLCAECERNGRYEIATVVDHVRPHRGDVGLFFDESNLQPLCKSCHDRKTAAEDGGFGREKRFER